MGLAALALVLITAAPEPAAVALSWTAPAACPNAVGVAEDLARLTGGELVLEPSAPRRIDVVVTARASGFVLVLDIATPELVEHRELDGSSCETLARAAALMIAVAVAPVASGRELPSVVALVPPPLESPSGDRAATAPTTDPPRGTAAVRKAPRDRGFLAVWTGPSFGSGPSVTAIVGGDVGWRRGAFGLQLSGWHVFSSERSIDDGIAVRASTSGGAARVVYALPVRVVELPLSFGVELGALAGTGTGARVTGKPTVSLWIAAALGIGLAWPAQSRVALALRTDALVTLRAPGIHLESGTTRQDAFVMPPVGVRVLAGPLFRFP